MIDIELKGKVKITDPDKGYLKARFYCAYQERCQQEVRDKLYEWGLWTEAVENIISKLITENFLNEERFAKAYAGGKFRIKKWGRVKIKVELKRRKISDYCIRQAMKEIDEDDYLKVLSEILKARAHKTKGRKSAKRDYQIGKYIISRGFEADLVWTLVKEENAF